MEIEVNGRRCGVDAAPDTPLLYVLRNALGLVGGCIQAASWTLKEGMRVFFLFR